MSKKKNGLPRVTYDISSNVENNINRPGYLEDMLEMLTGENALVKGFIQKYMHEIKTPEQAAMALLMLYDMIEQALIASRQVEVKVLNEREAAQKLFDMADKKPEGYEPH